jgi:carbonic anhydrase/SulP family sulfate permease
LAAILSCIDSRVPAELVFDLGIGDIFSVRVAGNVIGSKSLGSIEYAVGVAGVKLVLVLGHTRCGAVTSSVQLIGNNKDVEQATGCQHLHTIIDEISPSIDRDELSVWRNLSDQEKESFYDEVAKRNVFRTVQEVTKRSAVIRNAVEVGEAMVVGALYDVKSGNIEFLTEGASEMTHINAQSS